jgi:hypothetical protein
MAWFGAPAFRLAEAVVGVLGAIMAGGFVPKI